MINIQTVLINRVGLALGGLMNCRYVRLTAFKKLSFRYELVLFFILISDFTLGQPDTVRVKLPTVQVDWTFGVQRFFKPSKNEVHLPTHIKDACAKVSPWALDFDTNTDIPQYHAPVFVGVQSKVKFYEGYNLHAQLFAEDRGQSLGALKLDKVILFPRIYGTIADSLGKVAIQATLGDLINYRHHQGLTINNIDVQGATIKATYLQWWFGFTLLGDVSQHVGLNIGEVYTYSLGYELARNDCFISIAASLDYFYESLKINQRQYPIWNVNAKYKKNNTAFYFESALRTTVNNAAETITTGAFLFGYEF